MACSIMGAQILYWILFLTSLNAFVTASAHRRLSNETTPLGGYPDQMILSKRQEKGQIYDPAFPGKKIEPIDPPGNLHCHKAPGKDRPYRDSHRLLVEAMSMYFCDVYGAADDQDPRNLPILKMISPSMWKYWFSVNDWSTEHLSGGEPPISDDVYDFSIRLIDGCTPSGNGRLNLAWPVRNHKCLDLLVSAWAQCDNKGRGGEIEAGCLRYGISTHF